MVTVENTTSQNFDLSENLLRSVAEELQLPPSMDAEARKKYSILGSYLAYGPLRKYSPRVYAQGSQSYGTTVKPIGREEFDLDVVVATDRYGVLPEDLMNELFEVLKACPDVGSAPERLSRCVRVKFPGRMHLDFVPAVPSQEGSTYIRIPEKVGQMWYWKTTNPEGFTKWFESRCEVPLAKMRMAEPLPERETATAKPDMKVVVQLVKRHHQLTFHGDQKGLRTPSIVLTTIAGHVDATGNVFKTLGKVVALLGEVASWESAPDLRNPAYEPEVITEKWSDPKVFDAFRFWVEEFRRDLTRYNAAQGTGVHRVAPILTKMFGEEASVKAIRRAASVVQRASKSAKLTAANGAALGFTTPGVGARRKEFWGRS